MRIDSIRLLNFRCFDEVKIDFDGRLTVIVAPNGGGKTALLDAVAFAVSPFIGRMGTAKAKKFRRQDSRSVLVRADNTRARVPSPFKAITLEADGEVNDQLVKWTLQKRTAKGDTTSKDSAVLTAYADQLLEGMASESNAHDVAVPIIAYYGTSRIWGPSQAKGGDDDLPVVARPYGYQGCLSASSRFDSFSEWFKAANKSLLLGRIQKQEKGGYTPDEHKMLEGIVRNVKNAVQHVLAFYGDCYLDYRTTDYAITITDVTRLTQLELAQQSDGVQSILSMVGDIASRTSILNPQFGREAAKKTSGIVLIDEIDMHLHPSWQQVVLKSLQEAFPLIQFIVTTHSPQVLTTVPARCIRILSGDEEGKWSTATPDEQTRGMESSYAMASVMQTDPVPAIKETKWLNDYRALIEQGEADASAAQKLRKKLLAHFGTSHPLILDCDRLIRFQAFKRQRSQSAES